MTHYLVAVVVTKVIDDVAWAKRGIPRTFVVEPAPFAATKRLHSPHLTVARNAVADILAPLVCIIWKGCLISTISAARLLLLHLRIRYHNGPTSEPAWVPS